MDDMTFGEKLILLRKSRGMSQEALAQELEVSRQAVSRWELSETMPEVKYVVALSKFFGVTTDYLLHDESVGGYAQTPPAAPVTQTGKETDLESKKKKYLTISGIVSVLLGLLGNLAIAVASSFVEVHYYEHHTTSDGMHHYTGTTGYNYQGFLGERNLEWLVVLLWILVAVGVVMIVWPRYGEQIKEKVRRFKRKKKA